MPPATAVTLVIAPAHIRSMAYPGTVRGSPARSAALRPIVRPWSPVWVVAAIATSSTRSFGSCGLRSSSPTIAFTTRSSALVPQYMPFSPARPNGVRTPSTNTTSLRSTPPLPSRASIGARHRGSILTARARRAKSGAANLRSDLVRLGAALGGSDKRVGDRPGRRLDLPRAGALRGERLGDRLDGEVG